MTAGPTASARPSLGIVQGLSRDLGSAVDLDAVAEAAMLWIRAALGAVGEVSIARPDAAGRLRLSWRAGGQGGVGRKRSSRRRAAFETGEALRFDATDSRGTAIAIFPLLTGERTVGVLEVRAPIDTIDETWETLRTIGDHLAFALRAVAEREELRRELDTLKRAATLGRDLMRARSSEAAVRSAVRFVAERIQVPVAGWWQDQEGGLALAAVHGLGSRRRREVLAAMSRLPRWALLSADQKSATRRRFGEMVGFEEVSCLEVGRGILLAGSPTQGIEASLEVVGALLAEVLQLRSVATLAERRNQNLDMGIAWTAHELRGPLLGVRAVLELMLEREETGPQDYEILHRSLRELDHLVGTAEGLLAWAVGARPLDLRRADLVAIVNEAVESCRLEAGGDGIVVHAPEHVFARVDAATLRAALANLLRNALVFASPGSQVEVEVDEGGDRILMSVKDRGPMIPATEREAIFDPFVRGSGSDWRRPSSGLGLFITRRIVEAHHGSIWVESDQQDTAFLVVLPVDQGSVTRVAS